MKENPFAVLPGLLLGLALLPALAIEAMADVIAASPVEVLLWSVEEYLPAGLIVAVLVVTALLVRKFTKKK